MMSLRFGKDIFDYINNIRNPKVKQIMKRRVQEYLPKPGFADKFEDVVNKVFFIVFSAEWNSECQVHVSSLAKIMVLAKNNNLTVKVIDYDEYRDIAEELGVLKIPTAIVYDKNWRELGRFVAKPQKHATIEEELWDILDKNLNQQ